MEWNKGFPLLRQAPGSSGTGKGFSHGGVYLRRGNIPWETYDRIATSTVFSELEIQGHGFNELRPDAERK